MWVSDVFGQHLVYNISTQCPSLIDIGYSAKKSCVLTMDQHYTGNFFVQCWPTQIKTTTQIIFLCKVVHGLWVNIAQIIFLCNVGMTDQDNVVQVIFLQKHVCVLWSKIAQFSCAILPQIYLDNIAQEKILFNVLLILLGHCTGKSLVQCCPRGSRQQCTKKIMFNHVLILLGQHYTSKYPM